MRRILAILLLLLPFLCWFDQNFHIRVRQMELQHAAIDDAVRIVHISDLHGLNWGDDNAKLVSLIERQKPDLICVTGDMFTRGDPYGQRIAERLLKQLCGICPVFFVPGEHDRSETFLRKITADRAIIPDAEGVSLTVDGTQLRIQGCSAAYFPPDAHSPAEYAMESDDEFQLLLCHIPVPHLFSASGVDLMLSGDTHGGIIRLPLLGAVRYNDQWFPELHAGNAFLRGQYAVNGMILHVTSGLGGTPLRLCNPPEICVITLLPQ